MYDGELAPVEVLEQRNNRFCDLESEIESFVRNAKNFYRNECFAVLFTCISGGSVLANVGIADGL